MDALAITFSSITLLVISTNAVPPSVCSANFRWEDCGREPEPKMYYYKAGSRCEVGIWRGCHPSLNMFKDEYECVSTCIFSVRAKPIDFHNKLALQEEATSDSEDEITTEYDIEATTLIDDTTDPEGASNLDNGTNDGGATTLSADSNNEVSKGNAAENGLTNVNTLDSASSTTEAAG